jgi:hypothetical protein
MEPDPAAWKECCATDKWPTDEGAASYKTRTTMPTTTMPTATTVPTATAVPAATATAKPRLRRRRNQYSANYAHHYERDQILVSHGVAPAWERIAPSQTNGSARRLIPVRVDQDFVTSRRNMTRLHHSRPITAIFAEVRSWASWTWLAIHHSL